MPIMKGIVVLIMLLSGAVFMFFNSDAPEVFEISQEGKTTKIYLEKVSDSLNIIHADQYYEGTLLTASTWKLKYPVYHFECGDINNDGVDDILVGVIKATRFDKQKRKRVFMFKLFEGYIRPLWLGSRVSQPLESFRIVKNGNQNVLKTMEFEEDGSFLVCEYKWRGFGLEFLRYIKRNLDKKEAITELKK